MTHNSLGVVVLAVLAVMMASAGAIRPTSSHQFIRTKAGPSSPPGGKYPGYCGIRPWANEPAYPIPPPSKSGLTLQMVNMVIRHGDRLTTHYSKPCWANNNAEWDCKLTYFEAPSTGPGDSTTLNGIYRKNYLPGRNMFKGNCGMGQLTEYGYLQHVSNGEALRSFYVDKLAFLPQSYNPSQFFIRSDDEFRTVQSAQSLFEGFYPQNTRVKEDGTTEVVDMWTMDKIYDDMAPNADLCPQYQTYQNELVKSPAYIAHQQQVTQPLINKIKSVVNFTAEFNMIGFHDCLNTHVCHDFPWPPGFTMDLYNEVEAEATYEWQQQFSFPNVSANSQVGIGFLLDEISSRLNPGSAGDVKFSLFSGHDNTLMPLLNALGVWQNWTPYASWIIFETWTDSTSAVYIRVMYNGKELTIPGCPNVLCPISDFLNAIKPVLGQKDQCNSSFSDWVHREL
eukprot:TRINITY_DN36751_c0_g1_i1.p1 TRINITY_DN36751_c0_g1~~TRINITY_DN36751_c0_g1_i1.p1  ORF type:complete len:451 (-),score=96.87 TRINITY_DN36751_c0_g1_i1:29-1381(-)